MGREVLSAKLTIALNMDSYHHAVTIGCSLTTPPVKVNAVRELYSCHLTQSQLCRYATSSVSYSFRRNRIHVIGGRMQRKNKQTNANKTNKPYLICQHGESYWFFRHHGRRHVVNRTVNQNAKKKKPVCNLQAVFRYILMYFIQLLHLWCWSCAPGDWARPLIASRRNVIWLACLWLVWLQFE